MKAEVDCPVAEQRQRIQKHWGEQPEGTLAVVVDP